MKKSISKLLVAPLSALLLSSFVLAPVAEAKERGGGGGGGRQVAKGGGNKVKVNNNSRDVRSTNVRNTSVNNVNVKKNTNVNVNVDNDRHRGGWDNDYHPIATAAAVTATVAVTSAVIGSIVRTVPPSCVPVNYNGMIYQQCGSTWYQPQYVGPQVQYVVVAPIY